MEPTTTERQNFRRGVINGVVFQAADVLTDTSLVMVTFASYLTSSNIILGLVSPIRQAGWFLPQLWVSGWLQSQPRALPLYNLTAVVRGIAFGLLVVATLVLHDPTALLLAFLGLIAVQQLAAGIGGLSFMEVVARTISPPNRGIFYAWRLGLGGILGVGCGFVVEWALRDGSLLAFPHNFALLFGLAALFAVMGMSSFGGIREPVNTDPLPRANTWSQLERIRTALRADVNYRRLIRLRLALIAAGMGTPFFALYAQRHLGLPTGAVGLLLSINIAVGLLAYPLWGRLSARRGNRAVLVAAGALGVGVSLVMLAAPGLSATVGVLPLFALVFALVGVREAAINVSVGPLMLNIAPAQHRPLYVGFTNTVIGAAILVSSVSGIIVDLAGHRALFAVGLLAYAVALWQVARIEEPVSAPPMQRPAAA